MVGRSVSALLVFWILCTLHSQERQDSYVVEQLDIHRVVKELQRSWALLHGINGKRAEFYQLQSPKKCDPSHFLYPIKRNLFFVNEAQVSLKEDTVTVSTNGYNDRCNGKDTVEFRSTYVKTNVTEVGVES